MASLKPSGAEPGTAKARVNKYCQRSARRSASARERSLGKVGAGPGGNAYLGTARLGARPRPSGQHPRTAEIEARTTEIAKAQTARLVEKALFQARISERPLVNQGLKDETATLEAAAERWR